MSRCFRVLGTLALLCGAGAGCDGRALGIGSDAAVGNDNQGDSSIPPACGDGIRQSTEECDGDDLGGYTCQSLGYESGTLACRAWCAFDTRGCYPHPFCGNGVVEPGEQCDDGNYVDGDGCSSECQFEECGNGMLNAGEECDDANLADGDGCSHTCQVEPGWTCSGTPSFCTPICGDGLLVWPEECDDGNDDNHDDCPDGPGGTCLYADCGDGFVWQTGGGLEECDDGNGDNHDDCPDGPGGTCLFQECGDGFLHTSGMPPFEACDDGNVDPCDGCSNVCGIEECGNQVVDCGEGCDDNRVGNDDACPNGPGGTCESARCGDGFVWSYPAQFEDCDDGNVIPGDGCSATCQIE